MTEITKMNSESYWDTRFVEDWQVFDGPAQSRFFSHIAIDNLPEWFLNQLKSESLTLVDWGCAQGDGTNVWVDYIDPQQIIGVDFSGVAIEQAAERYPSIRFISEDWLTQKGDQPEVFDVVFSSNTLEHFHDPYTVLRELAKRSKKAILLALPYRELDRNPEHFFTFLPENIPTALSNGFRLIWSRVIDCRSIPNTYWGGEQIVLLYADPNWVDGLELVLGDALIDKEPFFLDKAQISAYSAIAERDVAIQERDVALRSIAMMKQSPSWRVTAPLRFAARIMRDGLLSQDRQRIAQALRNRYHRLPLPVPVKNLIRFAYHRVLRRSVRLVRDAVSAVLKGASFHPPATKPAPQQQGTPDFLVWGVIDWHFRHQRPQQLALALAATGRRVFYISPKLLHDERAGFKAEALDAAGRLFQINLFVKGAPVIYSDAPSLDHIAQLRQSVGEMMDWAGCQQIVSMVDHPFWCDVASVVPNSRLVYDCMDHHEGFGNNAESLMSLEKTLLNDAEITITTSAWLDDLIAPHAKNRTLIRNACEYQHFAKTPETIYRDPQGRRIIGYFGAIADWFDVDLVEAVAKQHPDCSVLLIGADTVNASAQLKKLPNVTFLGEMPYHQLPQYLHGFDVCLLPFQVIPLTLATNPVKIYEYLAAGKPVVAVDLPEMAQFDGLVYTAADKQAFLAAVAKVLSQPEPATLVQQRKAFAELQTWQHRAEALMQAAESSEQDPKVSVVVVTYNNLEFTRACLASLDTYSQYAPMEIIVVDNASSDGSPAFLSKWAANGENRQVILNDDNRGFAAANNQGLAIATGAYLVLLNNDTYVTPGWIRTLIGHLKRDKTIGLIGPVTNNVGNEAKIEIAYTDMNEMLVQAAAYTCRHIGQTYPLRTPAFFCVMMPRTTYERVGVLDEAFGRGFFEDDDYCRRIEQLGMRTVCAEDVFIHHHLSASFDKMKQKDRQKLFEDNKKIYEAKWGPWVPHVYRSPVQHQESEITGDSDTFDGQKNIAGHCVICGQQSQFFYQDPALWRESLTCEHCRSTSRYRSIARGLLRAINELTRVSAPSLEDLPHASNQPLRVYDTQPPFYYTPCAYPLPDLLKATGWIEVELSNYKPHKPMGVKLAKGITNQNLECLTFADASMDIVITSDVMEHVRLDDRAHAEIYRVLKPGGIYLFTVPHNRGAEKTVTRVQITDPADPSKDVHLLEPEYHADANSDNENGALAYRLYGRELEEHLQQLGFAVDYTRNDMTELGILSTELYYCKKVG
jgi:GT2 family glycosyltransferase/SAM-dependent methyltransferase/glycosyltransferase involved in cell wall biosynthesis